MDDPAEEAAACYSILGPLNRMSAEVLRSEPPPSLSKNMTPRWRAVRDAIDAYERDITRLRDDAIRRHDRERNR